MTHCCQAERGLGTRAGPHRGKADVSAVCAVPPVHHGLLPSYRPVRGPLVRDVVDEREPVVRCGAVVAACFQNTCAEAVGGDFLGPGHGRVVDEISGLVEIVDARLDVHATQLVEVLDFELDGFALDFGEVQTGDEATAVDNESCRNDKHGGKKVEEKGGTEEGRGGRGEKGGNDGGKGEGEEERAGRW